MHKVKFYSSDFVLKANANVNLTFDRPTFIKNKKQNQNKTA